MAARPSSSLAVTALLPLLLLVARVASVSAVDCPDGYTDISSHCFMIKADATKTWTDAEAYCETTGGHLAVLSDCDVYADVVARIHAQGFHYDFWIGATDSYDEGVWLWVTGELVKMGTPYWGEVSAGVQYPTLDTTSNCLHLSAANLHFFVDGLCSAFLTFICQTSPLTAAEEQAADAVNVLE